MKTIYFIRHAKSDWSEAGLSDFDRGLNKRGKRDLSFMASRLKKYGIKPDLILSSPAKRAKITAEEIADVIGYKKENISFEKSLYDSSYTTYRYLLDSQDNKTDSIFIVAHNPTLTSVAEILSGAIIGNMPTCSIVCMEFDAKSFKEIKEGNGKILFFDCPKKHKL